MRTWKKKSNASSPKMATTVRPHTSGLTDMYFSWIEVGEGDEGFAVHGVTPWASSVSCVV
ncbi:hypothetical protein GCM10007231_32750 [Nocardioides daphniae]|uniref:Uncharacterized protein n=1 Tax=Nocardioides daphniae TaxID=402297 RepID=A0ABQ1QK00_9ACTN|nr:hypothetical protein GCM10007231_32750 [Nocardioides daphniae]